MLYVGWPLAVMVSVKQTSELDARVESRNRPSPSVVAVTPSSEVETIPPTTGLV
jgi:hypothetical protein